MKIVLLSLMFMLSSCASAAKWKAVQVPFKDQGWRVCTKEYDGEELHLKGFCYWQKEVKKRRILKDLYRRKHLVCLFTNKECLVKFPLSGKKIR